PFCFGNCGTDGGGGFGDGMTGSDGGVLPGSELCNELDDDNDGRVDEGFDLQNDPANCGRCKGECNLPQAFPACKAGTCAIDRSEIGWVDRNGAAGDGCEYQCQVSGPEICDERDNDCDGFTDEGFDLTKDLGNCGHCGTVCSFSNATASCTDSACVLQGCNVGFIDLNQNPDDGCELNCTPLGSGMEACNRQD